MNETIVGIGEIKISNGPDDVLKTYALGSCVAVLFYDKVKQIAAMVHIALPDSAVDTVKARNMPGHFVNTAIPVVIEELKKAGVQKHNLWIKLIGGAKVMDAEGFFDIGKRNVLAIKKELWKSNLGPIAEDVGGDYSRTVTLVAKTGEVIISSKNVKWTI